MGDMADFLIEESVGAYGYDNDYDYYYCPDEECPECESKLVIRINKKTNVEFVGCSKFPLCKFSAELDPDYLKKPQPENDEWWMCQYEEYRSQEVLFRYHDAWYERVDYINQGSDRIPDNVQIIPLYKMGRTK
jgi:hypothetical protein